MLRVTSKIALDTSINQFKVALLLLQKSEVINRIQEKNIYVKKSSTKPSYCDEKKLNNLLIYYCNLDELFKRGENGYLVISSYSRENNRIIVSFNYPSSGNKKCDYFKGEAVFIKVVDEWILESLLFK